MAQRNGNFHLYFSPIGIGYFSRFTDLTGTDYSKGAVELARNLAARDGFTSIKFLVSIHVQTELFLSMHAMLQICDLWFSIESLCFVVSGIVWDLRLSNAQ